MLVSFVNRCFGKLLRVASIPLLAACRKLQGFLAQTEVRLAGAARASDPRRYSAHVSFPGLHADRELYIPDLERFLAKATDRVSFFSDACPLGKSALEIGPLHVPICRRPASDVKYLDAFTTQELRDHYTSDPNVDVAAIVDVDYVWRGERYEALIRERFDSVVTSHNIEHMPCLVDFLDNLESVLKPGGNVYLAIPDKRYCFDHYKSESSISDVLDAFILGKKALPASALVRQALLVTHNESMRHWAGDHGEPAFLDPSEFKRRSCRILGDEDGIPAGSPVGKSSRARGEMPSGRGMFDKLRQLYNLNSNAHTGDQHAWVFTPGSFAEIMFLLNRLGLSGLTIERLHPTAYGSHEFYVVLQKVV
jgi:SAM-dependent methyltransferase